MIGIIVILVAFVVCRFLGPAFQLRFQSSGEEKIGLSKNQLYNANGYIVSFTIYRFFFGSIKIMIIIVQQVHSGSDILLGSTGSFKRFDSVDRNAHEGELVYGQTTLSNPPWIVEESIPPQPLRPAPYPMPLNIKGKGKSTQQSFNCRNENFEPKAISAPAPLKSVPRPVARKQLSAPTSSCQIPIINPPEEGLRKIGKDVQSTTNPFLNGFINFESIKTNFFSTTVTTECKIENERATKSAFISKNPFINSLSGDNNVFDFNPNTIKSIMEETPDDGYLGDNDENDDVDPLKQLEERIQKIEASGKQRRKSESSSPHFSPKVVSRTSTSPNIENSNNTVELTLGVNEKFVDSSLIDESVVKSYRKHIRNRSFSENETRDFNFFTDQGDYSDQASPASVVQSSTNPFLNGKRLLKTPSETYLEQFSMMRANSMHNSTVSSKSLQLCEHPSLSKILQISPPLFETGDSTQSLTTLKRAVSSESISSESSVIFNKLERTAPPVTGNLCIALQYDK